MFLQFQACAESQLDQSTIVYQVVRRFILSKGFESAFGLQLLANLLNGILSGSSSNYMSFESSVVMKKHEDNLEEPKSERVSDFNLSSEMKPVSSKSNFRLSNNVDDGDSDTDDDGNNKNDSNNNNNNNNHNNNDNDTSNNYNNDDNNSHENNNKNNNNNNNEVYEKESVSSDVSESTVLYLNSMNSSRGKLTGTPDLEVNKKAFFSSDLDSSSSSCSSNGELKTKKRKRKRKKEDKVVEEEGSSRKKEKGESNKESTTEEKELEKLLQMADINPHVKTGASATEEKKEKTSTKSKQEEISLLDCLESENCVDEENPGLEKEKEEEGKGEHFFSSLNNLVKGVFLSSSDESNKSSEETEHETREDTVKKEEKKKGEKRKISSKKKAKKDDLANFRVPNLSSEEEEEETFKKEISKSEETGIQTNHENNISANCSEESDDSVKCVEYIKKKKREFIDHSETIIDSDSDSHIQQVSCKIESSPTKGRKNIKKILKKGNLQVETKQALKMETERKKRVNERLKLFETFYPNSDADSRLVLDFDAETKEELIVVDEQLSQMLKPHQKDGIRFMWNCCFESVKRLEEDSGSGCVLAHCMGLGKTLQVITLVHTVITHDIGVHTVLIICPLNTIRNWTHEFKMWQRNCQKKIRPVDLIPCKSRLQRISKVTTWLREGGVLVISYEMFRSLIKKEDKNSVFFRGFLNPGPDLVVCDEGHVLKNNNSGLSKCISQIKTLRRIILTGTPLQNNLVEYYCMVQFVKPNILGTMKEFKNRFVHPINNGQFEDSTKLDVLLMKRRSHVLHTMLDGFIQRFGYYVLRPFLPEKQEYAVSIALTETQENIYRFFIERFPQEDRSLLKDFHWLQKVWTHPRVLRIQSNKGDNTYADAKNEWSKYVREEEYMDIKSSGKLFLLFKILKQCRQIGDKVLVFSQSLCSLDLIEFFLRIANYDCCRGAKTEFAESWVFGLDYFRLDGSTNSVNRDVFCQKFNDVQNQRFRLFLVSTKAGGLGINLVAANRVVMFDASWNPTHDVQSIFRIYRFGQKKPCFIYRFLAAATMEEKIYRRQVTKLSLAHRILDEHQIERHYTMGNLQELYRYDPIPKTEWKIPKIPKDNLFAEILANNRDIIVGYQEHDSLLENKEEEELTEEDRRAAWEDYEKEKLTPEQPQPALNGTKTPLPLMNWISHEGLMAVQRYRMGPVPTSVAKPSNNFQNNNQLCQIVDVRSLQGARNAVPQITETERLLTMGRSLGMRPLQDESVERYCQRIYETLKTVFPWGLPGK